MIVLVVFDILFHLLPVYCPSIILYIREICFCKSLRKSVCSSPLISLSSALIIFLFCLSPASNKDIVLFTKFYINYLKKLFSVSSNLCSMLRFARSQKPPLPMAALRYPTLLLYTGCSFVRLRISVIVGFLPVV